MHPSKSTLPSPDYPSTSNISYAVWLKHFTSQLPALAGRYQLTPADVADVQQIPDEFIGWLVNCVHRATEAIRQPAMRPADELPPPQHLFDRVAALVQYLRIHPAYSPADGATLGVAKVLPTPTPIPTPTPRVPMPKLRILPLLAPGATPVLKWVNRRNTILELEVCRDGRTWLPLLPIQEKHYEDAWPQPPGPAEWQYRARYRWLDLPAGKWCRNLTVRVGPAEERRPTANYFD